MKITIAGGPQVLCVAFDWDGVLFDSSGASMHVYNEILAHLGMKPLTTGEFLNLQSPNWYEFYQKLEIPRHLWDEVDRMWRRLYTRERPKPYPDTVQCLRTLTGHGVRLVLVSNGSKGRVEQEVEKFGLRRMFELLLCGERKEELKPSPVLLNRAAKAVGLRAGDMVYVGDSAVDIEASRNAGMPVVAIARIPALVETLASKQPDDLFRNLEEMTACFVPALGPQEGPSGGRLRLSLNGLPSPLGYP